MQKNNILILKNSIVLFFRLIVTSVLGLFASRFVIHNLGASDYGLYSVVGGVVVMMAFLNTVMISTTYRFIAFEMGKGDKAGVNKVFNISLVIHLCLAFLVVLLTETIGVYYVNNYLNIDSSKLLDAIFVLRFSTYAMVFSIISIPYQGLVTAQEKFSTQAFIEITRSILAFFVALSLKYYNGDRLIFYALLIAIVSILPSILFFTYCNQNYSEIVKWNFQRDKSKYKEMIGFSGWILFGAAASVGKSTGSALIINAFFGTLLNAAFGIANQVNSIVIVFSRNLGQAAIPQITKNFSGGNKDRSINLAAYLSKYIMFLMFIPALPVLLETDYLLKLWLGEIPPFTVIFCQLIIADALIGGLGSGLPAIVQASGKIKYFQIILSITSLLSLPVAYVFFKIGYPPPLILVAFLATSALNVVIWQILLKKIINFDVKFFISTSYSKVLLISILVSPLFLIQGVFPSSLLRFVFVVFFSVCWLLTVVYFFGLEKKEKNMLIEIIIKIFKKKNG